MLRRSGVVTWLKCWSCKPKFAGLIPISTPQVLPSSLPILKKSKKSSFSGVFSHHTSSWRASATFAKCTSSLSVPSLPLQKWDEFLPTFVLVAAFPPPMETVSQPNDYIRTSLLMWFIGALEWDFLRLRPCVMPSISYLYNYITIFRPRTPCPL